LDEHDARVRSDEGCDQRAVVGAVGECLGRDDDVVPLTGAGAGWVGVGGGGGYRGEDGMRTEGVVAKGVGLEVDAIIGEGFVV
jgi:hypothetical protein